MEQERRDSLSNLLRQLSAIDALTEENKMEFYQKLEAIYHSRYPDQSVRHHYSDIFSTLTSIHIEEDCGAIENIANNLEVLMSQSPVVSTEFSDDTKKSLEKLYDHVNLDVARIAYIDKVEEPIRTGKVATDLKGLNEIVSTIDNKYSELQKSIDDLNQIYEKTKRDLEETKCTFENLESSYATMVEEQAALKISNEDIANAHKKITEDREEIKDDYKEIKVSIKDFYKENVTILGIFASIVLSFTGGISFSIAVFSNMHILSIYRVTGLILILGLTLTNILCLLFHHINQVMNVKETTSEDTQTKKSIFNNLFFWSNVIFFLLLACVVGAWWFDIVAIRNA